MIRRVVRSMRRVLGIENLEARLARAEAIATELRASVERLATGTRAGTEALAESLRRELGEQVRTLQLDQLELARPGRVTFRLTGSPQPTVELWRAPDGALAFLPETGAKPCKVAVVTLPKAGTYLMAEVLVDLGWVNTRLHAWAGGVEDGRNQTAEQATHDYRQFRVLLPIALSARLIRPGQFWVGHFELEPCRGPLADFKKIVMIRDLRFALVSYMRWMGSPGRGGAAADAWRDLPDSDAKLLAFFATHGRDYLTWCGDLVGWRDEPDVCVVRFEDLVGLEGEAARSGAATALAAFLGETPEHVAAVLRQSIGRPTRTYSGRLSHLEGLWSPRAEQLFEEAGGVQLNGALGYAPAPARSRVGA